MPFPRTRFARPHRKCWRTNLGDPRLVRLRQFYGSNICGFEGISGRTDQGAGILFNLKPNGDYLTSRANPLDNNLVLWKFEKDGRSSVKWIRDTRRHHANGTISGSGSPAPRSKVTSTASFIWSTIYLEWRIGVVDASACGLRPDASRRLHPDAGRNVAQGHAARPF
jgi:hypothetical protein